MHGFCEDGENSAENAAESFAIFRGKPVAPERSMRLTPSVLEHCRS